MSPFDWQSLSPQPVVGVDEVGRGCLAGPVYAAAVVLQNLEDCHLYTDSKKLSPKKREKLCAHILENHSVGIGFCNIEEISRWNILQASLMAMKRAIENLSLPDRFHVLVDGNQKIPKLNHPQTTLIKGDLRAAPVAAASIVAKVTRDQLMQELAADFPGYGFDQHKGYSTKLHKDSIAKLGPCPIHRPTFAGVKEYLI